MATTTRFKITLLRKVIAELPTSETSREELEKLSAIVDVLRMIVEQKKAMADAGVSMMIDELSDFNEGDFEALRERSELVRSRVAAMFGISPSEMNPFNPPTPPLSHSIEVRQRELNAFYPEWVLHDIGETKQAVQDRVREYQEAQLSHETEATNPPILNADGPSLDGNLMEHPLQQAVEFSDKDFLSAVALYLRVERGLQAALSVHSLIHTVHVNVYAPLTFIRVAQALADEMDRQHLTRDAKYMRNLAYSIIYDSGAETVFKFTLEVWD